MEIIGREKRGVIVYMYQEGRGMGLANKIRAMELERVKDIDTVEAYTELHFDLDTRSYEVAIAALKDLGINKHIRLITNDPRKRKQLEEGGFHVSKAVALKYPVNDTIRKYLLVKEKKLGHNIDKELTK
jgi:3,4-dihydroxy 2-butanone 4-phosphate synthase/GTP cyclohydrolase II